MYLKKNPILFLIAVLVAFVSMFITLQFTATFDGSSLLLFFMIFAFATATAGYAGWKGLFYYWLVGYIILITEIWTILAMNNELKELDAINLTVIIVLLYYPISIIVLLINLLVNAFKNR